MTQAPDRALPPDVRLWLCPAVSIARNDWAVPLVRASRQTQLSGFTSTSIVRLKRNLKGGCSSSTTETTETDRGAEPAPGAQPNRFSQTRWQGQSHSLTSGGKAVSQPCVICVMRGIGQLSILLPYLEPQYDMPSLIVIAGLAQAFCVTRDSCLPGIPPPIDQGGDRDLSSSDSGSRAARANQRTLPQQR